MKRYKVLRKIDDFHYQEVVEFTNLKASVEEFASWFTDVFGDRYLVFEVCDE